MAKAQSKTSQAPARKTLSKKEIKSRMARIDRGQRAITDILKREGLVMTARRVRLMFERDGKMTGGSLVTTNELGNIFGRPDLRILPQVELDIAQSKNGQ